jgi:hypothetical protein
VEINFERIIMFMQVDEKNEESKPNAEEHVNEEEFAVPWHIPKEQ